MDNLRCRLPHLSQNCPLRKTILRAQNATHFSVPETQKRGRVDVPPLKHAILRRGMFSSPPAAGMRSLAESLLSDFLSNGLKT